MSRPLLVAAGGGGDAIAAAILHTALHPDGPPANVATDAWERLLIDPLPGPRGPEWFTGLRPVGSSFEVTADSASQGWICAPVA